VRRSAVTSILFTAEPLDHAYGGILHWKAAKLVDTDLLGNVPIRCRLDRLNGQGSSLTTSMPILRGRAR
jgi:hypothetical protein